MIEFEMPATAARKPLRWRYVVTHVWGSMVGRLVVGEEILEHVWKGRGTAHWDIWDGAEHKVTGGFSGRYLGKIEPPIVREDAQ